MDSLKSDLVDLAFGTGVTSYLNLGGFGRAEKSVKVARYGQILDFIRTMLQ